MQDWKMTDKFAGVENAGLEIDGQKLQGVENDGLALKDSWRPSIMAHVRLRVIRQKIPSYLSQDDIIIYPKLSSKKLISLILDVQNVCHYLSGLCLRTDNY